MAARTDGGFLGFGISIGGLGAIDGVTDGDLGASETGEGEVLEIKLGS